MTEQSNRRGTAYDRLVVDQRRLAIGHVTLGSIACGAFWLRHAPPRLYYDWGFGFLLAAVTFFAWAPYLASWLVSHAALPGHSRVVIAYLVFATLVTAVSVPFYVTSFGMKEMVPPLQVSGAVSLALIVVAGMCVSITEDV
jgi:hypothetical protein